MSDQQSKILCIGSVLWDIIGRSERQMRQGFDVPGRIVRIPGGVAMNIAMTLARFGLKPSLLTALGQDDAGRELMAYCARTGIETKHVFMSETMPTDTYMAIEGGNGLIAAIADAHSLEQAGDAILREMYDGSLGSDASPYEGAVALDGNLTEGLLDKIAQSAAFSKADLRLVPASPGKVKRLKAIMQHPKATLYVNCEEAGLLCDTRFETAQDAAQGLLERGAHRPIVTHGSELACDMSDEGQFTASPPQVKALRITGAGDTFMAAHIAAEIQGANRAEALAKAQNIAARYVAGETPDV